MVVLVTGASGQLGQAIKSVSANHPQIDFRFADSTALDITDTNSVESYFAAVKPDFCINAAAYTAVDRAESEPQKARLINVDGARNIAAVCKQYDTTLIHISTDFVFDGISTTPYTEDDRTSPVSVYGKTKLDGEKAIAEMWEKHIIIRTSWLYSPFGNNFMKTMLRLASERDSLSVVSDQIGTPTNAVDLAEAIIGIIQYVNSTHPAPNTVHSGPYGVYHFSNAGQCSWYDFAKKIFEFNNIKIALHAIPTSAFPTAAVRPKYSVLDKTKISRTFDLSILDWEDSLQKINNDTQ